MEQKLIKVGARANDGTGDDLRLASTKTNANISALNAEVGDLSGAFGTLRDLVAGALASFESDKVARGHTAIDDRNYQALPSDVQIGMVTLNAGRTIYLPLASAYPLGQVLFIGDESGACSDTRRLTIQVKPGSGDRLAGAAAYTLVNPYQGQAFRRGRGNLWVLAQ